MDYIKTTEVKPKDSAAQIPSVAPCYLLPCPFCGDGDPEIEWRDDDVLHRCKTCGTRGPETWYEDGFLDIHGDVLENDAEINNIDKWNTRKEGDKCSRALTDQIKRDAGAFNMGVMQFVRAPECYKERKGDNE